MLDGPTSKVMGNIFFYYYYILGNANVLDVKIFLVKHDICSGNIFNYIKKKKKIIS